MGFGFGGYGGNCANPCDVGGRRGYGNSFALIVVLFILLIIVGAAFYC